jgi:hypothetical protein
MTTQTLLGTRTVGAVLTIGIVALTAATAYIHLTLGGLLFLLNGLGYAGLIVLIVLAAIAPHPLIARFDWFPRVALIGLSRPRRSAATWSSVPTSPSAGSRRASRSP